VQRLGTNKGVSRTFALSGDRWTRLPDLPQPGQGQIVDAATATYRGSTYALTDIDVAHTNPNDQYDSGSVVLRRLTATGWAGVPLAPGAPSSQFALTQVDGAVLATGLQCPGIAICAEEIGIIALLRPGASPDVIPLQPRHGVFPYPDDIAAAGQAVVVTYPEGVRIPVPAPHLPPPGRTQIYDIAAHRWLKGPTAPYTFASIARYWGTHWTPYRYIALGRFTSPTVASPPYGGWILRPVHQPPLARGNPR
jgi:hypothetical protein